MDIETTTTTKHILTMNTKEFNDLQSVLIYCMLHAPNDSTEQKNATKILHVFDWS